MILKNALIYIENDQTVHGDLKIENGLISRISESISYDENKNQTINCDDKIIIPGFIDQHTHGGYSYEFEKYDKEHLDRYLNSLPSEGVTSVYLTSVTNNRTTIIEDMNMYTIPYHANGARLEGFHLEGPFISREKKGAHPEKYISDRTYPHLLTILDETVNKIKLITLAPEKLTPGVLDLLMEKNISINFGHSAASYSDIEKWEGQVDFCFTHLYNAMSGHHHRNPGLVTYALGNEVFSELICDFIHVHKDTIKATYKILGSKNIILITDSSSCKGLEDGTYKLGVFDIHKKGLKVTLDNGTIAGSALRMIDAFHNIIEVTECSIHDAIKMTSTNASIHNNINDKKGSIKIGKDADLLILNKDLTIWKTIVNGQIVYEV